MHSHLHSKHFCKSSWAKNIVEDSMGVSLYLGLPYGKALGKMFALEEGKRANEEQEFTTALTPRTWEVGYVVERFGWDLTPSPAV